MVVDLKCCMCICVYVEEEEEELKSKSSSRSVASSQRARTLGGRRHKNQALFYTFYVHMADAQHPKCMHADNNS